MKYEYEYSTKQVKILIDITNALSVEPEFDGTKVIWRRNKHKNPDVLINFENEEVVVDNSDGMYISYSNSLLYQIAGIALLNELAFVNNSINY